MVDQAELDRCSVSELHDWLRADEHLLKSWRQVLDAIPECPRHGQLCVPHALEWIEQLQAQRDALLAACKMFVSYADKNWRIEYSRPGVRACYEAAKAAVTAVEGESE